MIYCCNEHIEEALDEAAVKSEGKALDVDKIVDKYQNISTACGYF